MDVQLLALSEAGSRPAPLVATDGTYLAWAVAGTNAVEVAHLQHLEQQQPLRICTDGQDGVVCAMALGNARLGTSDPVPAAGGRHAPSSAVLAVATRGSVVLWRLEQLHHATKQGLPPSPPLLVMSGQGQVDCMVMSEEANSLAVCAGELVHVFHLDTLAHVYRLEGHQAPVLTACFCAPHQPGWLLTAGEDRSFRLWDLDQGLLLYESPVLTASALLSSSVDPSYFRCALGAADGVVRFFDLAACPACRCLQTVDVAKQLARAVAAAQAHAAALDAAPSSSGAAHAGGGSSPAVLRAPKPGGPAPHVNAAGTRGDKQQRRGAAAAAAALAAEPSTDSIPCGDGVLALCYSLLKTGQPDGPLALLGESPKLMVGCMRALVVLDTHTYQLAQAHFFAGSGVSLGPLISSPAYTPDRQTRLLALPDVEVPRCYHGALAAHGQSMAVCCAAASSPNVYVLSATPCATQSDELLRRAQHAQRYGPGASEGQQEEAPGARRPAQQAVQAPGGPGPPTHRALSMFLSAPLPPGSPLLAGSGMAAAAAAAGGRRSGSGSGAPLRPSSSGSGGGPRGVWAATGGGSRGGSGAAAAGPGSELEDSAAAAAGGRPLPRSTSLPVGGPAGDAGQAQGGAQGPAAARRASDGVAGPAAAAAGKLPPLGRSRSTDGPASGSAPQGRSSAGAGRPGGGGGKAAGSLPPDKPVTFHRQIKSSGYGYVQPQVKLGRPPPKPVKLDPRPSPVNHVARQLLAARQYPLEPDEAPGCLQPDEGCFAHPRRKLHQGAVLGLRFSGDGSRLLSCSSDKTARVLRLPLSKHQGEGTDLLGHNGAVVQADWSHDSTMVLTASSDRTARLWVAGCAQPLLEFSHLRHQHAAQQPAAAAQAQAAGPGRPRRPSSTAGAAGGGAAGNNPVFLHEVTAARFFFLDRFVSVATGNKLHLYTFRLCDGDPKDDLSRLRNNNTYGLAASFTSASQGINSFACANTFQSPLMLLATSNRSVEVLDCATMQLAASVPDAHSRPVHTIVQAAGTSVFTSLPREASELFATCATDGLLKLWDVRVCRCVRTFSGHKNSQITVGAAFSPCLRFLACGSEDQAAHVYDLRQGALLHRLREPHGDAVTAVAFNPLEPQLAVGALNGTLNMYGLP